ncbi:hypothetical protein [Microbulbifer sp. TYP-18]|uniref:hypothetical protein n=1 Tax=Microbulbifer sp. TYP-18 TaxID=3230024 RepID=UPI0034C5EAEC
MAFNCRVFKFYSIKFSCSRHIFLDDRGVHQCGIRLSTVVGIAIAVVASPAAAGVYFKVMAGLNVAISLANGAPLGDVIMGFAVGMVTSGIGGALGASLSNSLGVAGHYLAGGLAGGVAAKALGGRFKDGFAGGLLGAAARHVMGEFKQRPAQQESLEATELSCSGEASCQEKFEEHWAKNKVKIQRVQSSEAEDVAAILATNQDGIDASALLNLKRETEGLMFKDGTVATVGFPGKDVSTLRIPNVGYDKSGNTIVLHFHPNNNPFNTQLLPSVADLNYSIRNNTIMVNVNPRDTSEYLIYRGVRE